MPMNVLTIKVEPLLFFLINKKERVTEIHIIFLSVSILSQFQHGDPKTKKCLKTSLIFFKLTLPIVKLAFVTPDTPPKNFDLRDG